MKQLIINADDFGRHRFINEAIEEAFRHGCLTSTTIMAGGRAFDDAVEIAKRNPSLAVGLHLTLVNGFPISDPKKIPSLVTKEGYFHPDYSTFAKLYMRGKIERSEVQEELTAQYEKVRYAGIKPTHFDSHQHIHHFPGVMGVAIKLAKRAKVTAMRIASTKIFDGSIDGIGSLVGRLGLSSLAKIAENSARSNGIATPDHFVGIVAGESISKEFMINTINNLEEGVTEIMIHPGTNNQVLQYFCDWRHDFEEELDALVSPKIMRLLDTKKLTLIDFSDLKLKR